MSNAISRFQQQFRQEQAAAHPEMAAMYRRRRPINTESAQFIVRTEGDVDTLIARIKNSKPGKDGKIVILINGKAPQAPAQNHEKQVTMDDVKAILENPEARAAIKAYISATEPAPDVVETPAANAEPTPEPSSEATPTQHAEPVRNKGGRPRKAE